MRYLGKMEGKQGCSHAAPSWGRWRHTGMLSSFPSHCHQVWVVLPTIISLAFSCQVSSFFSFSCWIVLTLTGLSIHPGHCDLWYYAYALAGYEEQSKLSIVDSTYFGCLFFCFDLPWLVQLINSKLTCWIHHFSYTFKWYSVALANKIQVRHTQLSI